MITVRDALTTIVPEMIEEQYPGKLDIAATNLTVDVAPNAAYINVRMKIHPAKNAEAC